MPDYEPTIKITKPYKPELLEFAQRAIQDLVCRNDFVFEYGSGHSTLWFAEFTTIYSVEHDKNWNQLLWEEIRERNLDAFIYYEPRLGVFPKVIRDYPDNYFGLVFVDCLDRLRAECIKEAVPKLKSGRYLVVDDTHWPMLKPALDNLKKNGWHETIIRGLHKRKTGITKMHQTSFLRKP